MAAVRPTQARVRFHSAITRHATTWMVKVFGCRRSRVAGLGQDRRTETSTIPIV